MGPERIETDDDLFIDQGHVSLTAKPKAHARWTRDELLPASGNPTLVLIDLSSLKEEIERKIAPA